MNANDVVIVSAVRTPFGRFDGVLKTVLSMDLGVMVLKEVVRRINLDPGQVDEMYYGTCIPAEYAIYTNVPARQITLLAGFPENNISLTIDRACCSSMTALRLGYRAIKSGDAQVVIASGAENMANAGLIASAAKARWGVRLGPVELEDVLYELGYGRKGFAPVATDAGQVAVEYGVTREMQDKWAIGSHQKYFRAFQEGKFKVGEELMKIEIPQKKAPIILDRDESPRDNLSPEKMAALKTVYGSPTVTAGNAPGLNSGASAMVLMSRQKAESLGLKPMAQIMACEAGAGTPKYMACVPAQTIEKMFARTGHDHRRHGPDRDQRGLCRRDPGFAQGIGQGGSGEMAGLAGQNQCQRGRRGHRPSGGGQRRPDHHDHDVRTDEARRGYGRGGHLRGTFPGRGLAA